MSAPQTRRVNRGYGHSYLLDGQKVPGVTTILSDTVPKPWMGPWTAKECATFVADKFEAVQALHPDRMAIIDMVKGAANRKRDFAALRGTQIHGYAERIVAGEDVLWAEIASEQRGCVEQYIQWLDDYDPHFFGVELVIANRTHRWMGTLDSLATSDRLGAGLLLIDIKTSASGAKWDTALQCAAYAHAEFWVDDKGGEHAMPPISAGYVLWLGADRYEFRPLDISDVVYRKFRYLQMIYKLEDQLSDALGDPLEIP